MYGEDGNGRRDVKAGRVVGEDWRELWGRSRERKYSFPEQRRSTKDGRTGSVVGEVVNDEGRRVDALTRECKLEAVLDVEP